MNNIDMIKMIISDINISKDEKYMLLIFKLSNEENKNNVTINIKALMEQFESRRKAKIFDILKSLQNKGYIEIIKITLKYTKNIDRLLFFIKRIVMIIR